MCKSGVLAQNFLVWVGAWRERILKKPLNWLSSVLKTVRPTHQQLALFAQKMMMGAMAISKHLSGDFRKTFWFFSATTAAPLGEFFKDVNNRRGDASVSCLIDTTRFRWRFIHDRFSMKFHVNDNEKEEENRVRQRCMNGSSPYRHSSAAAPRRSAEMFAQFISCLIMLIDGTFDGVHESSLRVVESVLMIWIYQFLIHFYYRFY